MAILLPNYLQTGSYSAKKDRRVNSAMVLREGIVRKGHFALAQRAAGANMSVDVAAGEAWVKGDSAVDQGYYHVVNDATVNVGLTAANATNPRIDAIVLAINDSTEVGGSDSYLLEAIAGTPTAGATLANLKGAPNGVSGPVIGATKLLLGYVLVAAAATKVETAAMGGLRDPINYNAEWGMTKVEAYAVAGAPPQYAHGRPLDWVPASMTSQGTGFTIPTGGETIMKFETKAMDTEEIFGAEKFTCKAPGTYLVVAHVYLSSEGAGFGTRIITSTPGTLAANSASGNGAFPVFNMNSELVRLGYGDQAWVTAGQLSGTSRTATGLKNILWQSP